MSRTGEGKVRRSSRLNPTPSQRGCRAREPARERFRPVGLLPHPPLRYRRAEPTYFELVAEFEAYSQQLGSVTQPKALKKNKKKHELPEMKPVSSADGRCQPCSGAR